MLSQRGIEFQTRDFFKERLSADEVRELTSGKKVASFFNFSSPTFKASGLDKDALSDAHLIELLVAEPRYIRRPIVVIDGKATPAAAPKVLEDLLVKEVQG